MIISNNMLKTSKKKYKWIKLGEINLIALFYSIFFVKADILAHILMKQKFTKYKKV